MTEPRIPERTDDEWRELLERWRQEARERIARWRAIPHQYTGIKQPSGDEPHRTSNRRRKS